MHKYHHFEVRSRYDESRVIIYQCLQNISSKKYMVDRADILRVPIQNEALSDIIADQLEMLTEEMPENRLDQFDSLVDAIENHDSEFEELMDVN